MQVVVGRVGRAHGVHGDVSIEVRTDEPERRFMVGATLLTEPAGVGPLTVQRARTHSGRLLLHFDQIDDRSQAETLRGVTLLVEVDQQESPEDPDEFYDRQLVGLQVHDQALGHIGVIAEVAHGSGQDLLVVRREQAAEVLVPFVQAIVRSVDLKRGRVDVELPGGLLDLAQD